MKHNEACKAAAQTKRRLAGEKERDGGFTDKRSDSFLSRSSLEVGEQEEAQDEEGRRQPSSLSMPSTGYAMAHTRCKQAAAAAFDEAGSLMNHPYIACPFHPAPSNTFLYIPLIGKSCRHAANRRQYG